MSASPAGPIGVGLIGYGFAGKTFHAPLVRAVPGLELAAVASSDAAKVHKDIPGIAVMSDPLAMIRDPRVALVVVATPNDSHAPLAHAALAAGKPVVIDKPFALDLAEARGLTARAAENNLLLSVFHNRRWDSDYLGAKHAVESGLLGTVAQFDSQIDRFRPLVRDRWRERAGPGAGVWYDLAPHMVDQALQLFGLPERIVASLGLLRPGAAATDWAHVVLEYPGRRVVLRASMLVAGGSPRFAVHGDKGSLIKRGMDRQEAQSIAGMVPGAPGWGEDPDDMQFFDANGGVHAMPTPPGDHRIYYAGIRDALRGVAPNPVTPNQALAVLAVMEAAIHADATGAAMAVPLTAAERTRFGAERAAFR